MSMKDKIISISNHFDGKTQKKKLQEELMELAVADAFDNNAEFTGEVADVIILIMQRAYQRGVTEEDIEEQIDCKLERTLRRVEDGYY